MAVKYWADSHRIIYQGDCRNMVEIPDETIQTVVTSPPYWGLRRYSGNQDIVWGDDNCEHDWGSLLPSSKGHKSGETNPGKEGYTKNKDAWASSSGQFCSLCGDWRGALGLEPTPELYISHMVQIMREIRRILRPDGVAFVNLGDSYYSGNAKPYGTSDKQPLGLLQNDYLFPYQDDAYQEASSPHISGTSCELLHESSSDLPVPNQEHKVLKPAHFGTSDCEHLKQILQFVSAIQGQQHLPNHAGMQPHASQESKIDASSLMFPRCVHAPNCIFFLSSVLPQLYTIQGYVDKMVCPFVSQIDVAVFQDCAGLEYNKPDTSLTGGALADHKSGKVVDSPSYRYSNIQPRQCQLKPLDLCLIPQRLAIALQADGWWVRSMIVWNKLNPMPESIAGWFWQQHKTLQYPDGSVYKGIKGQVRPKEVTWQGCPGCPKCTPNDGLVLRKGSWRATESHEYILMLTKSDSYFCDGEGVRERYTELLNRWGGDTLKRDTSKTAEYKEMQNIGYSSAFRVGRPMRPNDSGRNLRSVWSFPTSPFPGAHFAVFPEKLPELCIKAATPEAGCCNKCGAPWARVLDKKPSQFNIRVRDAKAGRVTPEEGYKATEEEIARYPGNHPDPGYCKTLGWKPSCSCTDATAIPSTVLDPFMGSGTTLLVAARLGRKSIGYDLSQDYCKLAVERNKQGMIG